MSATTGTHDVAGPDDEPADQPVHRANDRHDAWPVASANTTWWQQSLTRIANSVERWGLLGRWWEILPILLVILALALHHGGYWVTNGKVIAYTLGVVIILASVGLMLARQPSWRTLAALITLCVGGSLFAIVIPLSWTLILPYLVASIAVRRYPMRGAMVVLAVAVLAVALPALIFDRSWVAMLAAVTGVFALSMGALARRARVSRLEQAELALAREQAAHEEHTRAAALAERARIAREVHDVLAHSLSALSLNLQGARLMLVRDGASPDAVGQVERAQRLAAEGLAEARRAIAALREDPVPAARVIADLVTSTRLATGAPAELEVLGTPRDLAGPVEDALHRTAQEALSNARKHAPGAPIRVVLDYADDRVALTVTDHPGHRPCAAAPGGYGVAGMRERAALIGGELTTGPTDDGWRVRLVVPV